MSFAPPKAMATTGTGLARRVAGQGALLFSGYALAQAFSLARNAMLGHMLSKGDFGVAATLTLTLQMIETLSDLGADRIIMQAHDGAAPGVAHTAQSVLVLRGLVSAALLLATAPLIATFFAIPEAAPAFALTALVPLIKGFLHLDVRLAQRQLDNRPQMSIEVVPQALALALLWPLVSAGMGYGVVVWLGVAQAALAVILSHALASRRYRLGLDRAVFARILSFGWPIWASALPLIAVYHGDRIIVGRLIGMEALAGYSAAFMVAMVPGLLAAKVGHALMLPLLVGAGSGSPTFRDRFALMCEATSLAASAYLIGFVVAGGPLLAAVFGPKYAGLGPVVSWLALMWALRMVQAVPGMALMAAGNTRPLLTAGIVRALALAPALGLAWAGHGLVALAAAGTAGELASLAVMAIAVEKVSPGLARILLSRAVVIVAAGLAALAVALWPPAGAGPLATMTAASALIIVGVPAMLFSQSGLRAALAGAARPADGR
jgi:O-antigen/teichoic acid export membrane protein